MDKPPTDPADHAEDFAYRHERDLERYAALRMEEPGIPDRLHGTRDLEGNGRWTAFIARDRQGGSLMEGIAVSSGCLNPGLLKGKPGSRTFAKARLHDRIDAIIAHGYEEDRTGTHEGALKAGPRTELTVTERARRIPKAMSR